MENRPRLDAELKKHRSKVGNGRLLPADVDGRSATSRRFKDLVYDFAADLGGMPELSTAEVQMIRRASMLSTQCEQIEALAAQGEKEFDVVVYVTMTNALKRIFEVIGIKRRARDCTPRLSDYLQAREAPVAETIEADNAMHCSPRTCCRGRWGGRGPARQPRAG